jgi:OPA family glycerol-3-phosphate transporter-like MFS transporter
MSIMAPIAAWGITTTAFINFGYLKGFEGVFIYPALLAFTYTKPVNENTA